MASIAQVIVVGRYGAQSLGTFLLHDDEGKLMDTFDSFTEADTARRAYESLREYRRSMNAALDGLQKMLGISDQAFRCLLLERVSALQQEPIDTQ